MAKRRLPPRVKSGKNKGQFKKRKGSKAKKGRKRRYIKISKIDGRLRRRRRR